MVVCGGSETYEVLDASPYSIVLQKQGVTTSSADFKVLESEHNAWFTETVGDSSREGCFDDKTYTLCLIEPIMHACSSPLTETAIA